MSLVMFDSVDAALLPAGYAYAGYVNGKYANVAELRRRFPHADVLSITVTADADADCLDVEAEDADVSQVTGWVLRQEKAGSARPCIYASAGIMDQVLTQLDRAGIARDKVRLWSAHYAGEHICGPGSCGYPQADGTQWTDSARGMNLDQSLLQAGFFGTSPAVSYLTQAQTQAVLQPLLVLAEGADDTSLPHWYVHRVQVILASVYGLYKGTADGVYGPATAAAVKAFQGQHSLAQDGTCGAQTWRVLITGQ